MLSRNSILWLGLLLLLPVYSALAAQKSSPTVKPGTVKGTVTNSVSGDPVVRAHVVLSGSSGGSVYGAMTTSDGRFSIHSVPAGTYSVAATRRGYQPSTSFPSAPQITVKAGEDFTDLVVKLIPSAVISGQVVDEKNRPVPDASVEVIGEDSTGGGLSDDHGRFRIAGLSSSRFLVKAKNNSMLPPEVRTDGTKQVNYGTTYYTGTLTPESAVPVTTQAGRETEDVVIKLKPAPLVRISGSVTGVLPEDRSLFLTIGSATASSSVPLDSTNHFTIWGLDPGRHTLFAHSYSGDKLLSGSLAFYVTDTNLDNLVVTVSQPFVMNGKISRELTLSKAEQEAWPAQGRKLLLMPAEGISNSAAAKMMDIDASGDFKIPALSPARFRLGLQGFPESMYVKDVEAGNLKLENGVLDLTSGPPNQPLTVELGTDGGRITGQVLASNEKPATARVRLLVQSSSGYVVVKETFSANGPYSFSGLPPGKYWLLCQQSWNGGNMSSEEFAALLGWRMEEVEVGAGEKLTKDLKLTHGDGDQ